MGRQPDSQTTEPDKHHTTGRPILRIALLLTIVAVVWISVTGLIAIYFSDWNTRGTVGDTFGAVNALFSGLAFAGLIYALMLQQQELSLQRDEIEGTRHVLERQLEEMKSSRELQSQPLAIPVLRSLKVDRPRFFYSPPDEQYSAQSRYHLNVALDNPTQHPCVAVNLKCRLLLPEPDQKFDATSEFVEIVAPAAKLSASDDTPSFMFTGDGYGSIFNALRQRDPRKLPVILLSIVFKNIVGGHFRIRQNFRVYSAPDQTEALRTWHTAIVGFDAKFKRELDALSQLKLKHDDPKWPELFESIKSGFDADLGEFKDQELAVRSLPATFSLERISHEEYRREMSAAKYSQLITPGLYDCPAEIDSRK